MKRAPKVSFWYTILQYVIVIFKKRLCEWLSMYLKVPKISLLRSAAENSKSSNGIIYNKGEANADLWNVYRYMKCLFINIQKQMNFAKSSLLFIKKRKLHEITREFLGLRMQNF